MRTPQMQQTETNSHKNTTANIPWQAKEKGPEKSRIQRHPSNRQI